jgi:mRNA interferase MazF
MQRGDIFWVELDPTIGGEINKRRPCVLVSLTLLNRRRRTVIVVPLSSKGTPRPPLVVATPSAGADATARVDQIRAIDKSRLADRFGSLAQREMDEIARSLRVVLGL